MRFIQNLVATSQNLGIAIASLILPLALTAVASAGEWKAFDESQFKRAQSEGKTVVLAFHSASCSTCKKQGPVLEALLKEETLGDVVGFHVDYDSSKELLSKFNIRKSSTIVVFKDKTEVARTMGTTDRNEIRNLITKGI
jgi:thioredoxin-like negative regulator of GroEL